ncbi:hypothetical protein GALMADRAFT_145998 [Galerina marginata CBS 339.88]|uniref:Uncharacterized protein n=1 Tax=Galerina marginata (strain CBS 339.88) TaxID=685588 RepID=A0A067SG72_GALM3|nr:hypothetical protein GALMADRAFT_145998 [Galerina marginata CBS 339.88]
MAHIIPASSSIFMFSTILSNLPVSPPEPLHSSYPHPSLEPSCFLSTQPAPRPPALSLHDASNTTCSNDLKVEHRATSTAYTPSTLPSQHHSTPPTPTTPLTPVKANSNLKNLQSMSMSMLLSNLFPADAGGLGGVEDKWTSVGIPIPSSW